MLIVFVIELELIMLKTVLYWIVCLHALLLSSFALCQEQELDSELLLVLQQLLEQSHWSASNVSNEVSEDYIKQIKAVIAASYPDVNHHTIRQIENDVPRLVKQYVVSDERYAKHIYPVIYQQFSKQELVEIAQFIKTPTGQKIMSLLPQLQTESETVKEEIALDLSPIINDHILQLMEQQ